MKGKSMRLIILFFVCIYWIGVHLFLGVLAYPVGSAVYAISAVLRPMPTPSVPSVGARLQFFGTLLTIVTTIIVAFIGGFFIVYQVRKNRALQHENQRIQSENRDMQRRLDAAQHRQQVEDDVEKALYDDWLAARRVAQAEERQRRIEVRAAVKSVMVQAQTPTEREEAYRNAIHADPNISQLQVLDMAHPLEVAKVYVRLRVHQEVKLGYEIEPMLRVAESKGDPNALLKASFSSLETLTRVAMIPEEALQKYPRCVVLGDPGAGKSTLLKHLTLRSAERQLPNLPNIPVHIALGDFAASPKQDLIAFAAERWDERYDFPEDEARAFISTHLEDGSAMLLLDALDETVIGGSDKATQESYSRVLEAIDRIAIRYSKAPIIVTARKAGYYRRPHLSGFTELEVLDFRPEEIKEFVENWFTHHPAPPKHATALELNMQLERNSRMQSLAANPLLLCLIVLVYETLQDLPEKRAELYKQCVDTLLSRWDTSRDIRRRRRFRPEHKQQLLTEIAWHFHQKGRRYFPEDELLRIIGHFLPTVYLLPEESKAILNEIEEENGLLKEQAHGWHGFLHLTLQEYFVAQYANGIRNGRDELLKYCGDPWWEEVIMLYAGCVHDASPLIHELLIQEKRQRVWKDIFHSSLLLSGQCLAAKPRLIHTALRQEVISRLFGLLGRTSYSLIDEQIVRVLAGIGGYDAWGRLLFLLKGKQEKLDRRLKILRALGELGDQTAVPNITVVLKDKSDNENVRGNTAWALGTLKDQSVVPDLLAILKDKSDKATVRDDIAWALGELGDQTVVPDLLVILKDKSDAEAVRREACWALKKFGQREAALYLPRFIIGSFSVSSDRAKVLGELMQDYPTIRTFALSLKRDSPLSDTIYQTLWDAAPRQRARILMCDWGRIKLIRVAKLH